MVLLPDGGFGLCILVGEEGLEAWAEVDVPTPEAAPQGLGILVVVSPELAGLAREFLFCHNVSFVISFANIRKNTLGCFAKW